MLFNPLLVKNASPPLRVAVNILGLRSGVSMRKRRCRTRRVRRARPVHNETSFKDLVFYGLRDTEGGKLLVSSCRKLLIGQLLGTEDSCSWVWAVSNPTNYVSTHSSFFFPVHKYFWSWETLLTPDRFPGAVTVAFLSKSSHKPLLSLCKCYWQLLRSLFLIMYSWIILHSSAGLLAAVCGSHLFMPQKLDLQSLADCSEVTDCQWGLPSEW